MPKNSFQKLAEEQEKRHQPPPELEQRVMAQVHLLHTMGKAAELYVPHLMQMFLAMLGSTTEHLERMQFPPKKQNLRPDHHTPE